MFSGIIQTVGAVKEMARRDEKARMKIHAPDYDNFEPGESIAVNGVCLTVCEFSAHDFSVDLTTETLERTSFKKTSVKTKVNLERSLTPSQKISGHFVTGHIDQVATVTKIDHRQGEILFRFQYPESLSPFIVEKGSIAVDGISLTVAECTSSHFSVSIIPFTFAHTNLNERKEGDPVNIECDMIGKYVVKACQTFLEGSSDSQKRISLDLLKKKGFV